MAAPETKPNDNPMVSTPVAPATPADLTERPTSQARDERETDKPKNERKKTKPAREKTTDAATSEDDYTPIEPDDDDANPVLVRVPKNDEEITAEGNALAAAGSEVAGGNLPNAFEPVQFVNERVWAMDADHNTNARQGRHAWDTKPDYVETNRA